MSDGEPPLELKIQPGGISTWVHVSPGASRDMVAGTHGGALRVYVQAPAAAGAANAAVIRLLARVLGVQRRSIDLDAGSKHRRKRVRIDGESARLDPLLRELAAGIRTE